MFAMGKNTLRMPGSKPHVGHEYSFAFMIAEAVNYNGGGFPAYMKLIMDRAKQHMIQANVAGPYEWGFSGGDGITTPIHLTCSKYQ